MKRDQIMRQYQGYYDDARRCRRGYKPPFLASLLAANWCSAPGSCLHRSLSLQGLWRSGGGQSSIHIDGFNELPEVS